MREYKGKISSQNAKSNFFGNSSVNNQNFGRNIYISSGVTSKGRTRYNFTKSAEKSDWLTTLADNFSVLFFHWTVIGFPGDNQLLE